jgi:hypothetical protein
MYFIWLSHFLLFFTRFPANHTLRPLKKMTFPLFVGKSWGNVLRKRVNLHEKYDYPFIGCALDDKPFGFRYFVYCEIIVQIAPCF